MNSTPLYTSSERGYDFKQGGWLARLNPEKLIGLQDMLQVYAETYIEIGRAIESILHGLDENPIDEYAVIERGIELGGKIERIRKQAETLELAVSARLLFDLGASYKRRLPSNQQARDDIANVYRIIQIELNTRLFFFVPPERSRYYSSEPGGDPEFFGEYCGLAEELEPFKPAIHAFPSIDEDLREAGNCFVFGRYGATVYFSRRRRERQGHYREPLGRAPLRA